MTYQPSSNDNQDYALPSHFFDSEATQIAQPVKPLDAAIVSQKGTPKPARRSWMFGAIAVSALVGSLVTFAAFSFYQRRSTGSTPLNQQATTPATVIAAPPDLATFPSPEASPTNIAVSMDENDEPEISPSPGSTASSRPTLTEARRTGNANNENAANDSAKTAKDKADDDTSRRTTTTTAAEKQPKKDENVAADKNAEREAEERRAAERATAERLAAERAAARREEARRAASEEDNDDARRPRKVGKRGDDANDVPEGERPQRRNPQERTSKGVRDIFEGERPRRQQRRNRREGTSEDVRDIFEGQPPR